MVELVFVPPGAYRPEGAQNPKNGNDTHFPWGLIILWVASAPGSVVYAHKSDPNVGLAPLLSPGMTLNCSAKPGCLSWEIRAPLIHTFQGG